MNICNFLWKVKRPKIKMSVLKCRKEHGGLNLVDFEKKNASLKASWIVREDDYSQEQLRLNDTLGTLMWNCAVKPGDVKLLLEKKKKDSFWEQCIQHWFGFTWETYHKNIKSKEQILAQILWHNSYITIQRKPLKTKNLAVKGCMYVEDIVDENYEFLSHQQLAKKFKSKINWLDYTAMCQAIPHTWMRTLHSPIRLDEMQLEENLYDQVYKQKKKTGYIYQRLNNEKMGAIVAQAQLLKKEINVTTESMQKAFKQINQITTIVKLKDFQYRLLQNALHCNDKLYD